MCVSFLQKLTLGTYDRRKSLARKKFARASPDFPSAPSEASIKVAAVSSLSTAWNCQSAAASARRHVRRKVVGFLSSVSSRFDVADSSVCRQVVEQAPRANARWVRRRPKSLEMNGRKQSEPGREVQ